jgi:DNA-binding response OmpR family regulator
MTGTPDAPAPSLRLAVVEDDAELRERILLPALQASGFEARGFRSALELYRQWTRAPFDLVLLDVGLPDEDDVEIARHLRALGGRMGIVIYSAHGRGVDRLRGLRAGVDAYLVKPLAMDELVQTLRNLGRRVAGDGTRAGGRSGWSLAQGGWVPHTPAGTTISWPCGLCDRATAAAAWCPAPATPHGGSGRCGGRPDRRSPGLRARTSTPFVACGRSPRGTAKTRESPRESRDRTLTRQ